MASPDTKGNYIVVEPHWPSMRRWVLAMYETDPDKAYEIAEAMGCEAPELPEKEDNDG